MVFSKGRVKTSFRTGHGASDNLAYEIAYPEFAEEPALSEYFSQAWALRKERLEAQGRQLGGRGPATMFPNMSFSAGFSADDPGVTPDQPPHRNRSVAVVPHRQERSR